MFGIGEGDRRRLNPQVRTGNDFRRQQQPADFNLGDKLGELLARIGGRPGTVQDRRVEMPMAPSPRQRVQLQRQMPEDAPQLQEAWNNYAPNGVVQHGLNVRRRPELVPGQQPSLSVAQPTQNRRRLEMGYVNPY